MDPILNEDELAARLFRERLERRQRTIDRTAQLIVEEEQYKAAVEARATEIRRKLSMSLWQRLVSKLPFIVQRRIKP